MFMIELTFLNRQKYKCHYCPICNFALRVKKTRILFSQNRVENLILIIFDQFWTIFSEMVDFFKGQILTPYFTPICPRKKIFHNIFFPSFSCRFRKKKSFCRIFKSKNGHLRVFRETALNINDFV
jgi:hypothetical protein